jgi:hypothetical protein
LTDGYSSAPGSFLFSLRNNDDLTPFKAALKNENDERAIYRNSDYAPTFGDGAGLQLGHDLYIAGNAGSNTPSGKEFGNNYQLPYGYTAGQINTRSLLAGSYYFNPSEIEILYLM